MKQICIFVILLQALWCSSCKSFREVNEQASLLEKQVTNIREENNHKAIRAEEQAVVSHQQENEREQLEKMTIFFDTSLPVDSFSGLPPIRAIEHAVLIREKQKQQEKQAISTVVAEENDTQNKQTIIRTDRQENRKRKETSLFYPGLAGGLVLVIGGLCLFFFRK